MQVFLHCMRRPTSKTKQDDNNDDNDFLMFFLYINLLFSPIPSPTPLLL